MPFNLSFSVAEFERYISSPRNAPVNSTSTVSMGDVNIDKLAQNAPIDILLEHLAIAPPVSRPAMSREQIVARDALQEKWYKPLTHRQRKFVSAMFANGFDATKAALEVDPSLSPQAARSKGKYWYGLPTVLQAIDAVFDYYNENTRVRFEDIIAELRTIAFTNIMDFYTIGPDGQPELTMPKVKDARFVAISEINIEYTKFGQKSRVKLHDKMGAIDRLMKLLMPTAEDRSTGAGITIQNINIIPVPQGQFLPAPTFEHKPIIDVTPQKPTMPQLTVVRNPAA